MKRQLVVILNLSLVSCFVMLGMSIISPVLPQYALSFSIPLSLTGWAISSFALARVFMDIPAGFLTDRFGKKRIMLTALVMIIMGSLLAGSAGSFAWLIIGRIFEGLGSAMYITSATTWVAQTADVEHRGRYMALHTGLVFVGIALGPALGGYSAAHFGLAAPFYVYAILAFVGSIATITLKEPKESSQSTNTKVRLKDIPMVLSNGPFMLVNCSVLALFFIRAGFQATLVPLYASINLGLSETNIGMVLTVSAVITALFAFPSGWLSDRFGRKKPIMASLLLSAVAVLLTPLQNGLGSLVGIMAFYGFASGLQGSIATWPIDVAPGDKLGTSIGVYRVIGDIGMFLGPLAVTYVAQYTGQTDITLLPFLAPAVLALVVFILMIWARDPASKRTKAYSELPTL